MQALSPEQRSKANDFWRGVRQALTEQDTIIQELQLQVQAGGSQVVYPDRPHSSNSLVALRDVVEQVLVTEAQLADDASLTIEEICDCPPQWAMEFISRQKNNILSNNSELSCWLSGNVASHDNGYVKMNLRNTVRPNSVQKFTVQPWGHQLGIVASGAGHLLRLTTNGEYQVSYALCPTEESGSNALEQGIPSLPQPSVLQSRALSSRDACPKQSEKLVSQLLHT